MTASIHIVIVNWNAGECLRGCLESIAASKQVEVGRVTVVDNASSDDSAANLAGLSLPLALIRNEQNVGFAAACNQGAAGSTSDYLLFLNPDTQLLPETLATVVEFMQRPTAGSVGICGVQVLDLGGSATISCARFPTLRILFGKMTRFDRLLPRLFPSHHLTTAEMERSRYVDQVIGAFFLVRGAVFQRLGGFDERYFLYYEEVDFALRARTGGARSYFLKEARVIHAGQVSSSQRLELRLYHSLRSRLLYAGAHWRRWQARLLVALTLGVELPARLTYGIAAGDKSQVSATVSGYRMLLRDLPMLTARRR